MGWCKREKKMREKERYSRGRRGLYRRGRGGRRRNKGSVLKVLMCVELRRLGVNRQFLVEGVYMDDRKKKKSKSRNSSENRKKRSREKKSEKSSRTKRGWRTMRDFMRELVVGYIYAWKVRRPVARGWVGRTGGRRRGRNGLV